MSDERDLLSGYLDDELTAEERALVELRLAQSEEWRAELDDVRVARSAVRGLDLRAAPAGFWDQVTAGVGAAIAEGTADAPEVVSIEAARERRTARKRGLAWVAGTAAVAVSLGALFVIPGREQVRPNVTAVVNQHGATSAEMGDPISGLLPLGASRGSR